MAADTRMFNKVKYKLYPREFDAKWKAENESDRLQSDGYYHFHIIKVESKAPPQGRVFYRLYYRR